MQRLLNKYGSLIRLEDRFEKMERTLKRMELEEETISSMETRLKYLEIQCSMTSLMLDLNKLSLSDRSTVSSEQMVEESKRRNTHKEKVYFNAWSESHQSSIHWLCCVCFICLWVSFKFSGMSDTNLSALQRYFNSYSYLSWLTYLIPSSFTTLFYSVFGVSVLLISAIVMHYTGFYFLILVYTLLGGAILYSMETVSLVIGIYTLLRAATILLLLNFAVSVLFDLWVRDRRSRIGARLKIIILYTLFFLGGGFLGLHLSKTDYPNLYHCEFAVVDQIIHTWDVLKQP